jgi:hypothetical protein
VRLEIPTGAGGSEIYRKMLFAAGRAQHLVWSSAELGRKQPEFVHPSGGDGAADENLRLAHSHLFAFPLRDPQWLSAHRKMTSEQSQFVARALSFAEVFRARRAAGRVIARQLLDTNDNADTPTEARANDYAALMSEATGFAYDSRTYLADVLGEGDDPAAELQSLMFAAATGEVLRTRHGSRWWASRAARDELIDVWNTGTRYTIDELTRLIGGGAQDTEALAASHNESMRSEEE